MTVYELWSWVATCVTVLILSVQAMWSVEAVLKRRQDTLEEKQRHDREIRMKEAEVALQECWRETKALPASLEEASAATKNREISLVNAQLDLEEAKWNNIQAQIRLEELLRSPPPSGS